MGNYGNKVVGAKMFSKRLPYWKPGNYIVMIDVVKVVEDRTGGEHFVIEGYNLVSDCESRAVGTKCNQLMSFKFDSTPGNIKQFLCDVYEIEEDELTEEHYDDAISDENPFNGEIMSLETYDTETKKGNTYTVHIWNAVSEDARKKYEEIKNDLGIE